MTAQPAPKIERRRAIVYVRVRPSIYEASHSAADEYGVSYAELVDRALEHYLAAAFGLKASEPVTLP